MAENKNSFIFYTDWKQDFEFLTDEEAGKLIKHLLRFASDDEATLENEDRLLQFAAQKIQSVMKKDLKKYEEVCRKKAEAGRKGGVSSGKSRSSKQNEANEARASNAKQAKQNEHDNDNDNDIYIRVINNSFVSIKNFDETVNNFQGNKKYFFIAYLFWELWYRENQNSKTMKEAKVGKWIDDVRKVVEIDKTSVERLIGIYCYFTKCAKQEIGFDDFWYKTVKSVAAFRNKNKAGVYYIDQIIEKVNDKREKDKDFLRYVDAAITKFNQNPNLR